MNEVEMIIRINAYIQPNRPSIRPITLDGKRVYSVALDRSCRFADPKEAEITLTDDQLLCLFGQTFLSGMFVA